MDAITRAVELAKARALEIDAAYLAIILEKAEATKNFEDFAARIREAVAMMKDQCQEIRAAVAQHEPDRN
jgi:hypothetical protein